MAKPKSRIFIRRLAGSIRKGKRGKVVSRRAGTNRHPK